MYLLGPDEVYQVRVAASSVWVPEERIWAPEVFIIREGINFTVDDPTRLVYRLRGANTIAVQVGSSGTKGRSRRHCATSRNQSPRAAKWSEVLGCLHDCVRVQQGAPIRELTLQVDILGPKSHRWGRVPHRRYGMPTWTHLANGEGCPPLCGLDTEQ